MSACIIAETRLVYGFRAIIDLENSFIRINKIVMNNEGYQKTPEEFAKKIEEAAKVDREISSKLPHPGRGGAKKHAILNEYGEPKGKFNLSLTATAKLNFKELAEKYDLPSSDVMEQLCRSSKILEFVDQELDLAGYSEKIKRQRQEARERPENIKAAKYREAARKKKKSKKRSKK